jgi:hypothetical protein
LPPCPRQSYAGVWSQNVVAAAAGSLLTSDKQAINTKRMKLLLASLPAALLFMRFSPELVEVVSESDDSWGLRW